MNYLLKKIFSNLQNIHFKKKFIAAFNKIHEDRYFIFSIWSGGLKDLKWFKDLLSSPEKSIKIEM